MHVRAALGLVILLLACGTALACEAGAAQMLSPETIARQVGMHYGDPHATVIRVRSDWTEADSTPMYLMTVAGQLSKDGVQASTIAFSALATRLYVWDVRAYDRAGQQVWSDYESGACSGSCATRATGAAGVRSRTPAAEPA